jgi:fructokinase
MFTHLGACRDFSPGDIEWNLLKDARFFYSTGYMWDTEPQLKALNAAVDKACEWGIPCCFDLADPFVVDRYYHDLRYWIKGRFSILFGNREELSRMTGCDGSDDAIVNCAADLAPLVVMKVGSRGCIIRSAEMIFTVPGEAVKTRDTTGAGDSFAAGFLYGLLRKLDLERCGLLANRVASRIVQVDGCDVSLLDRQDILSCLD